MWSFHILQLVKELRTVGEFFRQIKSPCDMYIILLHFLYITICTPYIYFRLFLYMCPIIRLKRSLSPLYKIRLNGIKYSLCSVPNMIIQNCVQVVCTMRTCLKTLYVSYMSIFLNILDVYFMFLSKDMKLM